MRDYNRHHGGRGQYVFRLWRFGQYRHNRLFAMSELTGTLARLGDFVLAYLWSPLVPRLMNYVERTGKTELILIVSLGLCFEWPLAERHIARIRAFIMGALIAETHYPKVERAIQPIKDMFRVFCGSGYYD